MITPLKMITAITMTTGFIAFPAVADSQDNLKSWAKEAGRDISASMQYPRLALRQGTTGSASFVVTVNRDGDVLEYYPTGRKGPILFKSSAMRSLKNTVFPNLPESYGADQLSFKLNMTYEQYEDLARKSYRQAKERKGAVTGTRVTLLQTTTSVSGK